jgi:hypothetical protein
LVPDVFYSCCILYNFTVKYGTVDVDELMRLMAMEAEEEICQRHAGKWRLIEEDELQYHIRLEEGENPRHKARNDVVYYLAIAQPHRA